MLHVLNGFTCCCFGCMQVPCLNFQRKCASLRDNCKDGTLLCYCLLPPKNNNKKQTNKQQQQQQKQQPPPQKKKKKKKKPWHNLTYSYYLSQGRYLVHICIVERRKRRRIALTVAIRDFYNFLAAPRTVSNTYAQVVLAQSCAHHVQHIERLSRATCRVACLVVRRDSSAIKFDRV